MPETVAENDEERAEVPDEALAGLTEEERADMEGVSDDSDASEIPCQSEEYEIDSDEDKEARQPQTWAEL